MMMFAALLLQATALPGNTEEPATAAWGRCVIDHALPSVETPNPKSNETIVDEAFAACGEEERRLRDQYMFRHGEQGQRLADAFRQGFRDRVIQWLGQSRARRGR